MNITTAAESTTEAVVYWRKGDKPMLMIFQSACMTWRRSYLLALNRFLVYLEMAVFPQRKTASAVAEWFQRDSILHFHLCLCALNSATLPTSLSCPMRRPHLFVKIPNCQINMSPLPCDGSPLLSTTLAGVMALADFLMLCDGNIFNNETLREAHGGICRASHKSSKFLCGPGTATGLKKTKRKSSFQ